MSAFIDPLEGVWNDEMTLFTLDEEFDYQSNDLTIYSIPKGFVTDFASTPTSLKWLLPSIGLYGKAAVLHDFLYTSPHRVTKQKADHIFKEAMLVLGVPNWKAEIMYQAVKLFGQKAYNRGSKCH